MRMNICWIVPIILTTCYLAGCNAADPDVYVKIQFSFTWTEMCKLKDYVKEHIAEQIVMNDGKPLPANRIVLYNFNEYCPKGAYKKANVYLFASTVSNSSSLADLDEDMTNKIYKVVNYFYEQKLERYLGSLLVGKIENVEIAGEKAPEKSTAYTEVERLYIGLGVGLIIIIVVLVISVLVMYCKNRKNTDKGTDRYSASHAKGSENVEVRTYPEPSAKRNEAYNVDDYNRGSGLQTRF